MKSKTNAKAGGKEDSLGSPFLARLAVLFALTLAVTPACTPGVDLSPTSALMWEMDTSRVTVTPGQMVTWAIRIQSKKNINARVSLSASAPAGLTITFNPQRLSETASSSTMTVQTTAETPQRQYEIVITAAEDGGDASSHSVLLLVVPPGESRPEFLLSVDPTAITLRNEATVEARITPLNGFLGDVTLSITGTTSAVQVRNLPAVLTITPNFSSFGHAFLVVLVPGTPVVGPVVLTLTATSGSLVRTETLTVTTSSTTTPSPRKTSQ